MHKRRHTHYVKIEDLDRHLIGLHRVNCHVRKAAAGVQRRKEKGGKRKEERGRKEKAGLDFTSIKQPHAGWVWRKCNTHKFRQFVGSLVSDVT